MRRGLKLANKTIKSATNWNFNSKHKYNFKEYDIEDSYNLNSLLNEMNLDPLVKYENKIGALVTANDIDSYNEELLKKKNIKIENTIATPHTLRIGLIGRKVGMTSIFNRFGEQIPLSVVKVENNQVTNHFKINDKMYSIQVGGGFNPNISLAEKGHYYKNNIPPKKYSCSFKVTPDALLPIGYILSLRHFMVGQLVDINGITKGRGTQGVMQRWGFKGGVASHGNSLAHRTAGSIGNREFPARVWPGKKMSGKSGNKETIQRSMMIYKTDFSNGLIYIKGSIPGNEGAEIRIRDAYKKRSIMFKYVLNPTFLPEKGKIYEDVTTFFDTDDNLERYPHDNDERMGVSDEEEEGPAEEDDEMEMGAPGAA